MRPLLIARYYVLTTASLAAGLVGLAAPRDRRNVGGGGGHTLTRARLSRRDPPRRRHRRLRLALALSLAGARSWRRWRSAWSRPGPIIYRQRRSGLHGHEFDVLKLRTMVDGAEHIGAGLAINENDSRITRVGAFLRRTSLDELPNLVNVLRGEMSLIGPRPTLPVQVAQYTERQRGRLAIKPGITGWAQVNGRASLPWSERIELDLYYIEHRSLALDVQILRRTVAMVLGGIGPVQGRGRWLGGQAVSGGATERAVAGPAGRDRPAILLTGTGKRYDIVSCFAAQTLTIAADPSPLAPAQYAAHVHAAVPRMDDPGVRPGATGAVRGARGRRGAAADGSGHRDARARAGGGTASRARAVCRGGPRDI